MIENPKNLSERLVLFLGVRLYAKLLSKERLLSLSDRQARVVSHLHNSSSVECLTGNTHGKVKVLFFVVGVTLEKTSGGD